MTQTKDQRSVALLKMIDRPKVSFGPHEEKHRPEPAKRKPKNLPQHTRHVAKGHYTPNPGMMCKHPQIPNVHPSGSLLNLRLFAVFFSSLDRSGCHSSSFINIRPPSPRRPGLNLSDPSNPILHPPRLTYSSFHKTEGGFSLPRQEEKKKRVRSCVSPLLTPVSQTFICFCFFSCHLFLNSPLRVVTGNPWRCFLTLWTNTGREKDLCIITTTSCVS